MRLWGTQTRLAAKQDMAKKIKEDLSQRGLTCNTLHVRPWLEYGNVLDLLWFKEDGLWGGCQTVVFWVRCVQRTCACLPELGPVSSEWLWRVFGGCAAAEGGSSSTGWHRPPAQHWGPRPSLQSAATGWAPPPPSGEPVGNACRLRSLCTDGSTAPLDFD